MAKPDTSIDPRILDSAKAEFLAQGFEGASLKSICEQAGVTTGALYKRYKGKDELFCAVVAQAIEDMNAVVEERCSVDPAGLSDQALIDAWDMSESSMMWWFEFLFQRHDELVLLLKCAVGSSHSNFQHDWVERMHTATFGYYAEVHHRGLAAVEVAPMELHILITAFWTTIYEPFIHGYTWPQIEEHCKIVCRFFNWHKALGFIGA